MPPRLRKLFGENPAILETALGIQGVLLGLWVLAFGQSPTFQLLREELRTYLPFIAGGWLIVVIFTGLNVVRLVAVYIDSLVWRRVMAIALSAFWLMALGLCFLAGATANEIPLYFSNLLFNGWVQFRLDRRYYAPRVST
jgi:hypothetical protein